MNVPKQCANEMNTVGSCLAATVAFLVVAIGWCAADTVVCCNSSSVVSDGEDVVASCRNKNRTFHMVEAFGDGTCDDNRTAVPVRKCCPLGRSYDPEVQFCETAGADGDKKMRRMMQLLRVESRAVANAVMVGYSYEQPLCDAGDLLVDVPAMEVSGLIEAYSSVVELPPIYCFDLTPSDELVARTCRPRDQICGQRNYTCVPKCCRGDRMIVNGPDGPKCKQSMKPFMMSAYNYENLPQFHFFWLSNSTVLPYYDVEFNCSLSERFFGYKLITDGRLFIDYDSQLLPDTKYCMEYSPMADNIVPLICNTIFETTYVHASSIPLFYRASYVASAVCLALSLLVYNTLPSLRNIRNYYVKCYMGHQFVSCICVIYQMSTMGKETKKEKCLLFGYMTLFVFLSTLCWLNVICFDIYWTIRYNISINRNISTSARTIMYHFYCWGLSSIFVRTGLFFQYSQDKSLQQLAPNFGVYGCFYYDISGDGGLIFILIPGFVMLAANLVLFLLTTIHFSRIKAELNKLNRTDSNTGSFLVNKEKFVMSIKLFLIMGIPYFLTVLSIILRIEGTKWYIIYSASSLQGVFIFIIFVAKRNVIMDLQKKFGCSMDHSESIQISNISASS